MTHRIKIKAAVPSIPDAKHRGIGGTNQALLFVEESATVDAVISIPASLGSRGISRIKKHTGFIALMSAIIISLILFGVSLTISQATLSARFGILDRESKKESFHMAHSCMHIALLHISTNYFYTPPYTGETISFDSHTCTIVSVLYGAENITDHQKIVTITTRAEYNNTWTTLLATATIKNPQFTYLPNQKNIIINSTKEL